MNPLIAVPGKISISSLSYADREKGLKQIESYLELQSDSLDLLLAKAHFLTELGRIEEAKSTYLKAVTLAPTHFGELCGDYRHHVADGRRFVFPATENRSQ